MKKIMLFFILLILLAPCEAKSQSLPDAGKKSVLFNGKNLHGWYSFLKTKGKNNDPQEVFRVENGLLHISGQEFGYLCSNKSFKNFHLLVEFKWGEKKYAPRDTSKRDNGILYFVQIFRKDTVWPRSIECQIQEGDVGDFWLVDSTTIVVNGVQTVPKDFNRVQKKLDAEKPTGEWNTVEVIAYQGRLIHKVNGIVVNEATAPSVLEGKLIIQSEGAEIFYRKIEIAEFK